MVRKVSILCMVASLLFSLEAATPLVTQYIAPVDNPSWDNAVTNTAYGKDAGYVFTKIEQDGFRNYVTKVEGRYMVAWNKWVKFSNTTWLQSYQRSVCHPAESPFYTVPENYTVPEKRYLYPVTAENVNGGGLKWTVNDKDKITITGFIATYFPDEAIVTTNALDSSSVGAKYVQCVHTDWVYTVTFNSNDASETTRDFVFTNSAALPANAFSRKGHTFKRWNTANDGSGSYYLDGAEVHSDLNLHAIWAANSYNITFSAEDATTAGKRSCKVKYGESLEDLSSSDLPTRTGYAFGGYFSEAGGSGFRWYSPAGDAAEDAWEIDSDTTLYAKWTGVEYYVSYAKGADDVTGQMSRQTFIYGEPQALLENGYEREGYDFAGWLTHSDASVAYGDCATVSNLANVASADVVLYASWEKKATPETVNVVFDANGGMFDAGVFTEERNIVLGDAFESLPMPTNSNSSLFFAGWWTSTNPVDRVQILSTNIVDAAITNLYARWKAVVSEKPCKLTFNLADKTSTNVTAIVGDEFGRWFFDPTPQYTGGYRHFGWYRADGSRVEETDIIEDDTTSLTGRWTLGAFNDAWNCSSVQFETDGDNVSGWTMDETNKVARSGDVSGLAEKKEASSRLTMTPAVSGTLSIKLKTSCLPKLHNQWLACLYINSESDCIGGPDAATNLQLKVNSQFKLRYYRYGGDYSAKYVPPIDDEIEDCAWASDFSFVPDAAECPLPEWTALADKTLSAKTGGSAQWVVADDHHVSLVITNLPNARSGWVALETSKSRAGVLEFKWRTSCEDGYVDTNGVYRVCDRLEFQDERGERTLRIEGVMSDSDWESVVWTNSVESAHTFTWRYVKDGDASAGDDAAWIKDVKWTPFPPEPKPFRVLIW